MGLLKKIKYRLERKRYRFEHQRLKTIDDDQMPGELKKVVNLLQYTKTGSVSYSATKFDSGYHSFSIDGHSFDGQRNPLERFNNLPISLEGKTILDIGCNQGGMLYAFSDIIKNGVGIDYDSRMINAANKIASYTSKNNLDFYVFDLEKENLDYINDFLPGDKVDVVFLLSVCMWIKNWQEVIKFSQAISDHMIFESNGSVDQQEEQINYLKTIYQNVQLLKEKSDDDPSQQNRKLLYCY